MALTDIKVRSAKTWEKQYKLFDGDGLFLLIHPNGSKYWRHRFRFGGDQQVIAFGVYPEISLADARKKRDKARRLVAAGINPRKHKQAVKEEQAKEAITFESVAREWHAASKEWSEDHRRHLFYVRCIKGGRKSLPRDRIFKILMIRRGCPGKLTRRPHQNLFFGIARRYSIEKNKAPQ